MALRKLRTPILSFDEAFFAAELDLVAYGWDHLDEGVHGDESVWYGEVRYSEGEKVGDEGGKFEGEAVGYHGSPWESVRLRRESAGV